MKAKIVSEALNLHSLGGAVCLLITLSVSGCSGEYCPHPDGCDDQVDPTETVDPNIPDKSGRWSIQCRNDNGPMGNFNWYTDLSNAVHSPHPPLSDFDHIDSCVDWDEEQPTGGFEDLAREACSADCESLAYFSFECEDENWTKVLRSGLGTVWKECGPGQTDLDIDLIESELGPVAAIEVMDLPCDLAFTCGAYLTLEELAGLKTGPVNVAATAATAAETVTNGTSAVAFGTGDTPVTGEAAYTATSCGADACPFYLAQFDLEHSGGWSTDINAPSSTITKQVSALEISLRRPGLGIWLPNSGFVIFPSNSLMLEMSATIGGLTNTYSENGTHHVMFTNSGYAFGQVTFGLGSSTFRLYANGTDLLGEWRVMGDFETP